MSEVIPELPKARVRRIMKADEDVKMIKPDALAAATKATELFVGQFVTDAFAYVKSSKRKTMRMQDLESVVRDVDLYDFLTVQPGMLDGQGDPNSAKRQRTEGEESQEHDFWLPLSNLRRLARAKLDEISPEGQKISLEAAVLPGLVRAATVFVSLLTAVALETCGKRSTITIENMYRGLKAVEFEEFVPLIQASMGRDAVEPGALAAPKPKRALSGFFKFSQKMREQVRREHPGEREQLPDA
jgi:histone H3/H4